MAKADRALIKETASVLKVNHDQIAEKSASVLSDLKASQKEIASMKKVAAGNFADEAVSKAVEIGGVKAVITACEAQDAPALRDTADKIRDKIGSGVVFLASAADGKVLFTAMATKDAVDKGAHCGNIIREAAKICGGGGGGRPDMAQAGGKDASKIEDALKAVEEALKAQIGG
jgi:alanyl-tRNA synthetase